MMSFRRRSLFLAGPLALAACMGLLPHTAQATPSGLSNYPSTDFNPNGGFHFSSDNFSSTSGRVSTGSSEGLEYGVGNNSDKPLGRNELGFDYVLGGGINANHAERLLFNIKTQLFSNAAASTRLVAGVYGVGSKKIAAGDWLYLVGSKGFKFGRIHVGAAHSFASREVMPTNRTVLQLGFDKTLSPKVTFVMDYQSGKTQFIAPGLIFTINDKSDVQFSYLHGGTLVDPRNQLYLRFDYNFGKVAPPPPNAPAATTGGGAGGGGGGGGGGGK